MTFQQLRDEIEKDKSFSQTKLDIESGKIPYLHAKWLNLLIEERARYHLAAQDVKRIYKEKFEYFSGKAPVDVYINKPFDLKVLRVDLPMYIEADVDYQKAIKFRETSSIKIDSISAFIKIIHERQWLIKNIIEWNKFTSGNQV